VENNLAAKAHEVVNLANGPLVGKSLTKLSTKYEATRILWKLWREKHFPRS
jgi:hypothetical protein